MENLERDFNFKEKLQNIKLLIKNHHKDLNLIKNSIETLETEIKQDYLILEVILETLKIPNLAPETKKFLLEKASEICEKNKEFKKALEILKKLFIFYPEANYLEKIEKLKTLSNLEKLKDVLKKLPISSEMLLKLQLEAVEKGLSIERLLMERFKVPKDEILKSIENFYKILAFDLKDFKKFKRIPKILEIKRQFFEETLCLPVEYENTVYLLCYNPEDKENIERVKKILQLSEFKIAFALKEDILEAIEKYFLHPTLVDYFEVEPETEPEEEISELELVDSTIVNLVNSIIEEAHKRRASDIHLEGLTGKRGLQVRFRVDGECFNYTVLPESQKKLVLSRVKIMSNLDIAERRLPQDGKIKFRTKDGKSFEIRVATLPTIDGNEDAVLRILGGIEFRHLEELDLLPENYENFKKILDLPYGLILAVGPTGSGKTTTLHAALKYLNKPNKKIWTAEDPVEIIQDGLRQVQVNPKIGLTFARVLRSFLRADPDIIMIGETRDKETAQILIEASLTGHLVLSTLHTNSAPETVTRLLGMDIDPYNFADALLGVLAQRLAKRLCSNCKEPYKPNKDEIERMKIEYGFHPVKPLRDEIFEKATLYKPVGCPICNFTGFKGRIALHELLIPDDELKDYIIKNAPASEIRKIALQKGFVTLKQDGILKVLRGETTLKQVLAVTLR
ncbi:MAG: ATPase, T2SS/T4P/T4SS family [Thermodesulfobacteriaceae bacterium]|nr:ATPase, T2SS/T4P/T4SS family [Thermodesulfobacteriaceae bacterium]MDW8136416.1 ATPase, T2SS/T4P/T4SS family [Thermodesulfobacterium sp.]